MKGNDEIVETYYDLEEFIEELQSISKRFDKKIASSYIEQVDSIWCEAENERQLLEERVAEIENAEIREQNLEFERSRI